MSNVRLLIGSLNPPPRDAKLLFQDEMVLPFPYSPPLDPVANGVRVLINDVAGTPVMDATIPGGVFDPATSVGWAVDASGTAWRYKNTGATVPPIGGIKRIQLRDISNAVGNRIPGHLKFVVMGRSGSYQMDRSAMPIQATLVLDPPTAASGECGEAVFPGL